jgi:hypothetical protein
MGFQNAVLRQQVLILQKQFLVDETGHIGVLYLVVSAEGIEPSTY